MSLWWGALLLAVCGGYWTRLALKRQAVVAEIQTFLARILPIIEEEPGELRRFFLDYRSCSFSINYVTEDGLTILAGVNVDRTYLQVGASNGVDRALNGSTEPFWNFDAIGPACGILPSELRRVIKECRESRIKGGDIFLVYYPSWGHFLNAKADYAFFSTDSDKRRFERYCAQQKKQLH